MAQSKAETVDQYLAELPEDRREAIQQVRAVILKKLPKGYVEEMGYGMISYNVPLETFPKTSTGKPLMYAALASQKNHMAVYLSAIYANPAYRDWFVEEYKATEKRMDMGASCVRFKKIEQLPLPLIGKAIAKVKLKEFLATQ